MIESSLRTENFDFEGKMTMSEAMFTLYEHVTNKLPKQD